MDTDNSSDQRSNFKKANKPSIFEIFVIPEASFEDEQSASAVGRSRDVSSQNTSSDNARGSNREVGRRYFKESKRFYAPKPDAYLSMELNSSRDLSDRVDKSTFTDQAESNSKEKNFEDKSSNKDDSFKKMVADQVCKYEKTHARDFFLSKPNRQEQWNFSHEGQLDDSADAPVKDSSYDFFKDPSSLLEKSKNRTIDLSDQGQSYSDPRTNSMRLNDSDNPKFIDLGKFNSLDTSKNSGSNMGSSKPNGQSSSVGPMPRKEGDHFELDFLPTRQTNKDKLLLEFDAPKPTANKLITIRGSNSFVQPDGQLNLPRKRVKSTAAADLLDKQSTDYLQTSAGLHKLSHVTKRITTQKVIEVVANKTKPSKRLQSVTSRKMNSTVEPFTSTNKKETSTTEPSGSKKSLKTTDFIQNIKLKLASLKQTGNSSLNQKAVDSVLSLTTNASSAKKKGHTSPLNKTSLGKSQEVTDSTEKKLQQSSRYANSAHYLPTPATKKLNTPQASKKYQLQPSMLEKSQDRDSSQRWSVNGSFAQGLDIQRTKADLISTEEGPFKAVKPKLPAKNSAKSASAGISQSKLHRLVAKIAENKVQS